MGSEYDLIITDYQNNLNTLKRQLHMKRVRILAGKQDRLTKLCTQRKLIKVLEDQVEELKPTVSLIYCPQSRLKDNEIKGYIIYLLKLKEYYEHEVKTKQEMIQEREEQSKKLVIKLSSMLNEYAKKRRALPKKPLDFVLLDNTSNRLNQIEKRICTVQHENKEIREKILAMRAFQRLYTAIERDLTAKIDYLTAESHKHLDGAVSTYEDRDGLKERTQHMKERYVQDTKKAEANQTAVDIINEKVKAFDEMIELQKQERSDSRVALTSELIEKGVTGLEPTLQADQSIHSTIVDLSGGMGNPEAMEEKFRFDEDLSASEFSYLNSLMRDIHHTQEVVDTLERENRKLLRSLSTEKRKMRWEIEENEKTVDSLTSEAEIVDENRMGVREKLDALLRKVKCLYILSSLDPAQALQETKLKEPRKASRAPEKEKKVTESTDEEGDKNAEEVTEEDETNVADEKAIEQVDVEDTIMHSVTDSLEEKWLTNRETQRAINDSNAIEFFECIENNILEYLRLLVYIRSEGLLDDDTPMKADEEIDTHKKTKIDPLDTIVPRALDGPEDLLEEHFDVISNLQDLKPEVVSMISAMESEASSLIIEDTDDE